MIGNKEVIVKKIIDQYIENPRIYLCKHNKIYNKKDSKKPIFFFFKIGGKQPI
jgi:hypothetical protein